MKLVVAYKNPIIEALFHPSIYSIYAGGAGRTLMQSCMYAHDAKRVKYLSGLNFERIFTS